MIFWLDDRVDQITPFTRKLRSNDDGGGIDITEVHSLDAAASFLIKNKCDLKKIGLFVIDLRIPVGYRSIPEAFDKFRGHYDLAPRTDFGGILVAEWLYEHEQGDRLCIFTSFHTQAESFASRHEKFPEDRIIRKTDVKITCETFKNLYEQAGSLI